MFLKDGIARFLAPFSQPSGRKEEEEQDGHGKTPDTGFIYLLPVLS